MSSTTDKYAELSSELEALPFISAAQAERWANLQQTIDGSRDYLIRAVPDAKINIDTAQKILEQRTYTLVFFGGTGVGKSTLINSILGRNLLPTGAVTAVTGTIVYIEQAEAGGAESLTFSYWTADEFSERVRRLCYLAEIDGFDIGNDGERNLAKDGIVALQAETSDIAKTERDEYFDILLDCIATYENHKELFKAGSPPPQTYRLDNEDAFKHLREDSFKGSDQRQIRLIKSATFHIHPPKAQPDLLMNGYLRIVDVPGLGAGMKLHEAITLEEMKKEDAMIVLVTDGGRQRVDELKSMDAVNWVKENRLKGLRGADLDDAAAKIFYVVNGGNIRQAYDRLTSGLPEAEREIKEVTRHIAPNYWERYKDRGNGRPYFLVMPPAALYVQDPDHSPEEFASESERIIKTFKAELGKVNKDPLDPDTKAALLELSEIPRLRESLAEFIKTERTRSQLREAESRVMSAVGELKSYYENSLADRNVYPPFDISWDALQERRYESLLRRTQKELPRIFHNSLVDLSQRTNNDADFRRLLRPTLEQIKTRVDDAVKSEVDTLLDQYGTEHWDDRDVTFDNLIWGTSGIELPIKRILYQVELAMQEAVSQTMPRLGDVMTSELKRTLQANEIKSRLDRASYGQDYAYTLPFAQGSSFDAEGAYDALIGRIAQTFRGVCEQAAMYELVKSERSIHHKLAAGERDLAMPTNERLLDIALEGVDAVRRDLPANNGSAAASEPAAPAEEEFSIKLLDEEPAVAFDIKVGEEAHEIEDAHDWSTPTAAVENSYADMLDDVGGKTKQLFASIVDDLFSDDDLLPRLRRLFWLEVTRAERDFNNHIVKPLVRNHDRKIHTDELRAAMEPDLESVSDMESLMRTWEGLDRLEKQII